MLLALVLAPSVVLASLGAIAFLAPTSVDVIVLLPVALSALGRAESKATNATSPLPAAAHRPDVDGIVERLCVLADLPKPAIVIENEQQPNSWLTVPPRGRAQLHLTVGLLVLLGPSELEAVIGHELAHLSHHDAAVMSVIGGYSDLLLASARREPGDGMWGFMLAGAIVLGTIGWLSRLAALTLARDRELIADAGSAALTQRPAALASALLRVSERMRVIPHEDLRVASRRDIFHLVAVDEPTTWLGRLLTATHPSLETRIDRLEHLERAMHR